MIALSLKEVATATGALLDAGDPDRIISSVAVDSRAVRPGSLFVALPGERADGHDFVEAAARAGAVASLVTRAVPGDGATLIVEDTILALRGLAEAVRARLSATVVAITGSAGKTSTRAMTAAALATERETVAATANHNNEIGVPLTIFGATERTEALVVEVGARGVGHIAALMPAVRPDVAVVTNVGAAHLGMFGTIENTARAKGELVEALDTRGVAVLNADDEIVAKMASRARGSIRTFGMASDADVRGADLAFDHEHRGSFAVLADGQRVAVTLRVPGDHMVSNALAAVAAALACGVSLEGAAAGVARCDAEPRRMQIRRAGARRIIDDSYNASPDSMAAALKTLVAAAGGRPTWAVLGPMAELGPHTLEAHDRIGRLAVRLGVGHLVTVGTDALALHEAARLEGMPPDEAMLVADVDDALGVLRSRLEDDAVVLVKASRAAGLERIVEGLVT